MSATDVDRYLAVPGRRVELIERAPAPCPALAEIAKRASWLKLVHVASPKTKLHIEGCATHGEITFVGPVEGRLLEALVELLRALATSEVPFDTPATPQLLRSLDRRVAVSAHVTPRCPFCPAVTAAVLRLALATPRVDVVIVRADLFVSPLVKATPSVLIDGALASVGPIHEHELAEKVMAARR